MDLCEKVGMERQEDSLSTETSYHKLEVSCVCTSVTWHCFIVKLSDKKCVQPMVCRKNNN